MSIDRFFVIRFLLVSTTIMLSGLLACEDEQAPPVPTNIKKVSGDAQVFKSGEQLENPLVVSVKFPDGAPAEDFAVTFEIIEGNGQLTQSTVIADADGMASTALTLDLINGVNRVRASIAANPSASVEFEAEGISFFCQEEDPIFDLQFSPGAGIWPRMYLLTRESGLNQEAGEPITGIVEIFNIGVAGTFPNDSLVFSARSKKSFPEQEDQIRTVPWDLAFSRSGDLFVSWRGINDQEILKIENTFAHSHFSDGLLDGLELTGFANGILVGCNGFGPFLVDCLNTPIPFQGGILDGTLSNDFNNNAIATNASTGDIYFIYLVDNTLRRMAMNGSAPAGPVDAPTEILATLSEDQANGANGMTVYNRNADGRIFILVDTENTKEILQVTPDGTVTVVVDFFTRSNPGVQREIVVVQTLSPPFLFTVDTLNNELLLWDSAQGKLTEVKPSDSTSREAVSALGRSGERIGFELVPEAP